MESSVSSPRGCAFLSNPEQSPFIPEEFGADEQLMIQTAEQFSRKEVLPLAERLDKQEEGLMPRLILQAGELGFCGMDAPDQYGGLGLGKNLAARCLEFLSLDASFSVTVGITSGISVFGLIAFGNEAQKAKYLPKITSGEWIGAYCLSEPNSGTDALGMTTKAELKGDKYVLNGTKMWISNAKWANFFLVLAKVDGEHVTAFLVERDFPGVSISREEHKMGLKGSSTARVVLENAEVPVENVLYEVGKGHHVAFNALNMGRFKLGAMSLGPARQAMGLSAAYALDRKQFNQPIANFGLIRKKFADMSAHFFAAESALYRTGALIDIAFDSADGTIDQLRAAAEQFAVECSIVKVACTEAEARIVDEAFQVYGGYGYTEEFPIARIYRDARVSRIYEGTNEINRVATADRFLRKMAKEGITIKPTNFVTELCAKAINQASQDQEKQGALSDLLLLSYTLLSSQSRAKKLGGLAQLKADRYENWANIEATRAFQTITSQAISVPQAKPDSTNDLADLLLRP